MKILASLAFAALPTLLLAQSNDHWHETSESLKGLVSTGYEIKGFNTLATGRLLTHRFLLQKGSSVFMCSDSYSVQGSAVKLTSQCRELQ